MKRMTRESAIATFEAVTHELGAQPWFAKLGWTASCHDFPFDTPEFVTFHVSKRHWFNEDRQGIHFESFLAYDESRRKRTNVTLHIVHHAKIPGTDIKRSVLAKRFVDSIFAEVSGWKGYAFRTGKYGIHLPFLSTARAPTLPIPSRNNFRGFAFSSVRIWKRH